MMGSITLAGESKWKEKYTITWVQILIWENLSKISAELVYRLKSLFIMRLSFLGSISIFNSHNKGGFFFKPF